MSGNQGGFSSQPMGGGYGMGNYGGGSGGFGNQTGAPGGYGMPGYKSSQNYGYRPQQYGGFGGGFGNPYGGGFGNPMGGPMGNQTGAPQSGWWGSPSANTPYQNPGASGTPNPFQGFPAGFAQQGGFSRFARTPPQREGFGMSTNDLLAPPPITSQLNDFSAPPPIEFNQRDYEMQNGSINGKQNFTLG